MATRRREKGTKKLNRQGRQVFLPQKNGPPPRQLEKVLNLPQPRLSEVVSGKISRITADLFAKYLYRLGREIDLLTKTSRRRTAAIA